MLDVMNDWAWFCMLMLCIIGPLAVFTWGIAWVLDRLGVIRRLIKDLR